MKFSDLNLHPALSAALAARGYETATGVQAAVLDPGTAGRDLLVSSQTGSGKTIAFGVLLAEALLGSGKPAAEVVSPEGETKPAAVPPAPGEPAAPRAFVPGGKRPAALVIVPTRELAVQVRDELGWLLAKTRLRLGSFTGGTPVSGDLRVLQKGVDVVIGTPGRLVDLLSRERLDLAGLRLVVLDEADEMLDLGFREDLETLLGAANPDRRTLLLSATLPSEIRALARKYQRDALAIDPRKSAGESPAAPHADINYVAHLISPQDRLATVVNVLRASGARRTITFCTTRDAVSSLHAALMARGFTATAISGERAQADRDRALELIRSGRAEVLVATNVAARGLHLPDVDLIIHADLPLNSESLTHRSGRTGRAGRKGTAVVIATLAERRKAERLMALAHVVAPWTPAPTPDSITSAARERLLEALIGSSVDGELVDEAQGDAETDSEAATAPRGAPTTHAPSEKRDPALDSMLDRLEAALPSREILARLLRRELERLPGGEPIHPVAMPDARDGRGREMDARARTHHDGRAGVLFRVNMGARDKADPKWMLPLICRRGNVTRREVGAIRIGPTETIFEITEEAAYAFGRAAAETDPRAPHVRVERVSAGPGADRGPGVHRGPGPAAPARFSRPAPVAPGGPKRSPSRFAKAEAKAEPEPSEPVTVASTPEPDRPAKAAPVAIAKAPPVAKPAPTPVAPHAPDATTTAATTTPTSAEGPAPIANGVAHPAKSKRGGSAPLIERKHAPPPRGLAESARPGRPRPAGPPTAPLLPRGKPMDAPRAPSPRIEPGPAAPTGAQGGFGPPRRFTPHPVAGWGGEKSSERTREPLPPERQPSRGGYPAARPARPTMTPGAHHAGDRGGGGALGGGHGFGKRAAPFRPGGPRPATSTAPGGAGDLVRARPKPGAFAKSKPSAGGGFRQGGGMGGPPIGRAARPAPKAEAKAKAKAPRHRK